MNWKRIARPRQSERRICVTRATNPPATRRRKKIPDRWVPTTCGYCSVGCGIEIGVKDGQAVASAAARRASGESRQALPQGPLRALHHRRGKSREVSAAAQERQAGARRLGRSARHDGRALPRRAGEVRRGIARRAQHRPACHRRILHARQAGAAWLRHQQLRRQHHALHGQRGFRLQALVRQRRTSGRLRRPGDAPTWFC